jgi:two-component system OmpR family sensor kinase
VKDVPAGVGGGDGEGRGVALERQSHVRHELLAPLAAMYPLVSLLADGGAGPLTDSQRDYLATLERNVLKLHALIGSAAESGWLDVAAAPQEPAAVPLAEAAGEVIARLGAGEFAQAQVRVVAEGRRAVAWADPEHVRCLVRNLVDNALRHGGTGAATVRVGVSDDGAGAVLVVEDEGRGMPAGEAAAAFEFGVRGAAAVRAGVPGLGIGLWVCRDLAEANGGSIGLDSAEGRGTSVTVTLPATRR